ncbi:unnamed protein product [Allacma fusca]|uniref:Transmembrane protein 131 n=1 Tax=Allacma fusca TaxID=39272 RepID=A0A8J2JA34_9HEXA|nr:unnamed protein product [Allacma fusca]
MSFLKRYLVILFLQIGCLALDHSTRELTYEEGEIRLIMGHQFPGEPVKLVEDDSEGAAAAIAAESQQSPGNAIISFHPKFFNFKQSPVGMPRLGVVRVENRLKDENLKLISISGNTVHFHSSFFADKMITPGGNTTFEVVFLSRMEGPVESNLYIHTSKGLFKYHVRGFGLPNPYRLRPLVGARIPVNGSYEPLITMHNPHDKRIQVVEMLSSGTDFHLTLPDGVPEEGEGAAWAIEPFQTKSVMKGSFQGKTEGNHTGYIKIRVNSTTVSSEYLLVPVEVQVSSAPGIYSPQDSLDFGLLVRSDKPKTLKLSLINAQHLPVNVQSISVKGDSNAAVRIEFRPLFLEPDSTVSTVVALVTFDPSLAYKSRQTHGMIEIRSECGLSIGVPFRATVLPGELQYNTSSLGFFVKADNIPPRNFSVRNNYSAAIAIYQVSVSHPEIVHVDNFNQSQIIPPGEQKAIFTMKVQKKAELCDSKAEVQVTLKSNITNLRLPITCYDGKLHLQTVEENGVDFGRVELFSMHTEYFALDNANPVEVRLKSWGSNATWTQVELVGMQKGSKEDLARIKDFDSLKKSLFLQSGHVAVFSIEIRRPSLEGAFWGEAYVTTDHNQTIRVPFRFSVSKGCVHSDVVIFDKAFPGKISFEKLHLGSTFNHTLSLRGLKASPPSSMWFTPVSVQENPEILPHRKNYVGKVHFDPRRFCGSNCYSGFSTDTLIGKEWVRGVNPNWETGDVDLSIYLALQKRFESVKKVAVMNMSLWVETSELSGYKMKTQVSYSWPRLTASKVVVFPLTALANETIVDIPVTNPSNSPLLVQAILASQYGPSWQHFVSGSGVGGNLTEGNIVFTLDGVVPSSSHSNGSVIFSQVQKQFVQDILGVDDSAGVTFFLPPSAKFLLKVKFGPISKDVASTVILLRNNLTAVEALWLKGRAGTGQLTIGNGAPGSSLLLQITEKLLQGCQSEQTSKYVPPQLTVRRSFIARNIGEIPLEIKLLEIYPPQGSIWTSAITSFATSVDACEGYGFRILNCHPFTLLPNQTHSIDIAFTPDFTMARIVRSLRLTDSAGGQFNYSLVAMVPSGMLSICAAIISRPTWEPVLKYLLAAGIVVGIIAAALMAYFEAGSVVSSAVVATVRVIPAEHRQDGGKNDVREVTSKLDLKAVYDKVDNRFKRNQSQSPSGINGSTKAQTSSNGNSVSFVQKQQTQMEQKENNHVSANSSSSTSTSLRNRKKKSNQSGSDGNSQMMDSSSLGKIGKGHVQSNGHAGGSTKSTHNVNTSLEDSYGFNNNNNSTSSSNLNTTSKKNLEHSKKKKSGSSNNSSNNISMVHNKKEGKTSSLLNFGNLNLGKMSNGCSGKEEETSSTTTESSNPDDVMMAVMMVRCDEEMREKERTLSGKSASSGSSSDNYSQSTKSKSSSGKDGRKGSMKENGIGSYLSPLELKDFDDFTKSKCLKKKDFNTSMRKGSVSPKHDSSLWDTPRAPSGDGFSELATQTQLAAFVMNRPAKRTGDRQQSSPNNTSISPSMILAGQQHFSNGGSHASNSLNSSAISRNQTRKPGVIGQHRMLPQMQSNSHPPSVVSSFGSLITATLTVTMASTSTTSSTTNGSRQHTLPVRTTSCSAQGWGSEILPDNGCDIWNRKNSLENGTGFSPASSSTPYNVRPSISSSRQDTSAFNITAGYFPHQNGFSSNTSAVQPGHGIHSHNHNLHQPHNFSTRHSPKGNGPSSTQDSSYLFSNGSGITNELINNLWQLNSTFDNQQIPNRVTGNTTGFSSSIHQNLQSQQQASSQVQHGFLHRMRSDPSSRTRGSGYASSNWNSSYFNIDGHNSALNTASLDIGKDSAELWPSVSSSGNSESVYSSWNGSPPSVTTSSPSTGSTIITSTTSGPAPISSPQEIWETTSAAKWPSSYGNNGFNDSMAVGSSRVGVASTSNHEGPGSLGNVSDLNFRTRVTDVAQSQREVEAGLGFNPFTSDIWNQHQTENPGWSNPYRYSSNNE